MWNQKPHGDMPSVVWLTDYFHFVQMGQQNVSSHTRWGSFLPSGIPILSTIFIRPLQRRTYTEPRQPDNRIFWQGRYWGETISAKLQHWTGVEGPLWGKVGDISTKEKCLWPIGHPSPRTGNIPEGVATAVFIIVSTVEHMLVQNHRCNTL